MNEVSPSSQSEYVGIRIALGDALQRYYADIETREDDDGQSLTDAKPLTDAEKIGTIRGRLRDACRQNGLLGRRNFAVAESWANFIESCEPSRIVAFLEDPEIIAYASHLPPLKDKVATLTFPEAIDLLSKSQNFALEQIAQRTGLIDVTAGESLSEKLHEAELRMTKGQLAEPRPAENPEHAAAIRKLFDSPFGNVKPAHMGLPPAARAAGRINGVTSPVADSGVVR